MTQRVDEVVCVRCLVEVEVGDEIRPTGNGHYYHVKCPDRKVRRAAARERARAMKGEKGNRASNKV